MIPYSDEIMNRDYIGSFACMPNEPKSLCWATPFLFVGLRYPPI